MLDSFVRADLGRTLQQHVDCVIEVALGRFQVSGFELVLSRLIFLLGVRNQIGNRVRLGRRRDLGRFGRGWFRVWFRLGNNCRGRRDRGSHSGSVGLRCRQLPLALISVAGGARQKQCQQRARSTA